MTLSEFIHQKSYERVELLIRRDLVTLLPFLLTTLVLGSIPVVLKILIDNLFPGLLDDTGLFALAALLASVYYLSIALFFYTYFVTFYLDLLVITNDRLIEVTQTNLFFRSVSEMDIAHVQNVTSEIKGLFGSIFGYGTLLIQDSSAIIKFELHNVPNPDKLRQKILELAEIDRKFHLKKNNIVPM